MSDVPQTPLDLQVVLTEILQMKAKEFEAKFDVLEKDGKLVVAIHRDSNGKAVWLERNEWITVNNYVRDLGGEYVPREKLWELPLEKKAKNEAPKQPEKKVWPGATFHGEEGSKASEPQPTSSVDSPPREPHTSVAKGAEKPKVAQGAPSLKKLVLSEFNINFDFKDDGHIDLLTRQIQNGSQLEIICYEEDGVLKVIDGGHSLVAYEKLGLDPLENAKITVKEFENDADKIAFSRRRNENRIQNEPIRYTRSLFQELQLRLGCSNEEETRQILRRFYNLQTAKDKLKLQENKQDQTYNNVIIGIFEGEKIKASSFISNHLPYLDFPEWLANMVDQKELSPSQASIINNGELVKNEELQKRVATQCIGKEVRWTREFVKDVLNFTPQKTAFWYFLRSSNVFGDPKFPGRCNGELMRNLLHYYSKEGDLIVDPMAGSGTTIDVSKLMNRKCLAYDIKPYREDIKQHDITKGFPSETKNCDLVFLDPPYYKKKEKEYGKESVSSLSKEDFLKFMGNLARASFETVKPDGIVALLVSDYFAYSSLEIILSCDYWKKFREAGFEDVMRVTAPLPLASLKATWPEPEDNIHALLDVNRDLYIFRKPRKEAKNG